MSQIRNKKAKPTKKQLMKAIDVIYERFDADGNGELDHDEVSVMLTESLRKKGKEMKATQKQV
mgnify:CR=1 FL=1